VPLAPLDTPQPLAAASTGLSQEPLIRPLDKGRYPRIPASLAKHQPGWPQTSRQPLARDLSAPPSIPRGPNGILYSVSMATGDANHVFVSYVREDADKVDNLCDFLTSAQIPYWRDRTSLAPGDAWKTKIREAIQDGSLIFLACFSEQSRTKVKSHMNEELTIAVDEFRKFSPGHTWLIPVRFDDGPIPGWELGAGRMLSDLNYVDLFGPKYVSQATALVTTIARTMGDSAASSSNVAESAAQTPEADRPALLKRSTKDMLLDPVRRIQLDDLVSQEVAAITSGLNLALTEAAPLLKGATQEAANLAVAEAAAHIWKLTEPFCQSLQVAARWGSADGLDPWRAGMRAFAAATQKVEAGYEQLLDLRHIPAIATITTATLACTAAARWDNLRSLVVDATVKDRYANRAIPLFAATSPHDPFAHSELAINALARVAREAVDLPTAVSHYAGIRGGRYYTPLAEWLHSILRPTFIDQIPDDDSYDAEFDRAEVILGALSQDDVNQLIAKTNGQSWARHSRWYGRSTHRAGHFRGNAAQDLVHEFEAAGNKWLPLEAGLFGGSSQRAKEALNAYRESFNEVANGRF